MKKALLVFALVAFLATGTVFAELTGVGEPTVTGSVSTTLGYDLDSQANGFYNDSSLTLTLPLLDGDMTKGGDDDMYGEITVDGIGWQLNNDGFYDVDEDDDATDTSELDASISAKLVLKDFYVDLGAPSFSMNNVDVNDDYTVDANFWEDDEDDFMGIALGFMNDMVTFEAKVANRYDGFYDDTDDDISADDEHETGFNNDIEDDEDDDYTQNSEGYVLGVALTLNPAEGISIPVSFAIDMSDQAIEESYMAFGAAPSIEMGMLTVDLPVDYVSIYNLGLDVTQWGFEVAPSIAYCLTEAGGSNVAATFVYGMYEETVTGGAIADLEVVFTETEELGFVDALAAEVKVGLVDIMDYTDLDVDMGWDVDFEASYNMDGLVPYVNGGYGSNEVFDLGLGVKMNADFTGLDNTVLTLDYTNEALTESDAGDETESGRVTFDVTVSF
jgi:hypothetical protein